MIACRKQEEGDESVKKLNDSGWKAIAMQCDVSVEEDVKRMVGKTIQTYGAIDIAVIINALRASR